MQKYYPLCVWKQWNQQRDTYLSLFDLNLIASANATACVGSSTEWSAQQSCTQRSTRQISGLSHWLDLLFLFWFAQSCSFFFVSFPCFLPLSYWSSWNSSYMSCNLNFIKVRVFFKLIADQELGFDWIRGSSQVNFL